MQHLGTEDELVKILQEFQADMPPEQRLAGLSSDEIDRLRAFLQHRTKTNGSATPDAP